MKLKIQMFGGRGATSSKSSRSRGTGSGFFGEEDAGYKFRDISGGQLTWYAGDKITRQSDGKEFTITSTKNGKLEIYGTDGTEMYSPSSTIGFQFKERGQIGNRVLAKQRTNILRNADDRTTINGRKVAMYNKVPKGFIKLEGATTAPNGYDWYFNGKSRFGDEYINILVKNRRK